MTLRRSLVLSLLVFAISCSSAPSRADGAPPPGPTVVTDAAGAKAALGKPVRIQGTARDAKLGAAVVAGELVVFLLDRDAWPEDLAGRTVTAEGVLEQTDEFVAKPDETGAVPQGTEGPVLVIRKSTLVVAP